MDIIKGSGLEPTLFSAEETKASSQAFFKVILTPGKGSELLFLIRIKDTPIKFIILDVSDSFYHCRFRHTQFKPGFPLTWWSARKSIDEAIVTFSDWLKQVASNYVEERVLPDYWSQIETYKSFASGAEVPTGEGEKFTEEEKEAVRNSVQRFRALITEHFDPTPEQAAFIDERLDYLARATDRLNRFDWQGLAMSVVVSIAVNLSVDTERGRVLFNLFKQAFQSTMKMLQ
ncbi:MAG: hypothetical protein ACJ74Q_10535 [Pyrinomonadaceae bacterium]